MKIEIHGRRIIPKCWLSKMTQKLILALMRSTYSKADHSVALRFISQTLFEELQRRFYEDNHANTLALMVDENLRAANNAGMAQDHPMYKMLDKVVN
jgi:hypothetical protein